MVDSNILLCGIRGILLHTFSRASLYGHSIAHPFASTRLRLSSYVIAHDSCFEPKRLFPLLGHFNLLFVSLHPVISWLTWGVKWHLRPVVLACDSTQQMLSKGAIFSVNNRLKLTSPNAFSQRHRFHHWNLMAHSSISGVYIKGLIQLSQVIYTT